MSSAPATSDLPIVVQDRRQHGFFTIDNALLDQYGKDLKPTGIAVYNGLARYANRAGECWPSQTTLANLLGMSRMQVSREVEKLKRLGLIEVQPQYSANGGQRANLYILLTVPEAEPPVTASDTPRHSPVQPPVTASDTPRHRQLHKQHPKNKPQTEQDTAEHPVVVALISKGISKKVALRLAANHNNTAIEQKLEFLEVLEETAPEKVLNPCGWLRTAIEQDYAPPDGFQAAEVRAAEAHQAQRDEEAVQQLLDEHFQEQETQTEQQQQAAAAQLTELQAAYGTTQRELDLWQMLLAEFEPSMPSASFTLYVADTVLLSVQNGEALIGVPNPQALDWLQNRFATKIQRTLASCLKGQKVTVRFVELPVPLSA
jgi:biotin operon repressor